MERAHRIGPHIPGKIRPIRDLVWTNCTKLRGTDIWISEYYPKEVQEACKVLYPILRAAQKEIENKNQEIKKVSIVLDKFILNGKLFKINELDALPLYLSHTYTQELLNSIMYFDVLPQVPNRMLYPGAIYLMFIRT
jgi:hypothetical protein